MFFEPHITSQKSKVPYLILPTLNDGSVGLVAALIRLDLMQNHDVSATFDVTKIKCALPYFTYSKLKV